MTSTVEQAIQTVVTGPDGKVELTGLIWEVRHYSAGDEQFRDSLEELRHKVSQRLGRHVDQQTVLEAFRRIETEFP